MTATALVLFGGLLVEGLLDGLSWRSAAIGLAFVLLWRPATGMLGLLGCQMNFRERLATSFFGIRGVGSFYYLAYAAGHAKFPQMAEVWALVAFTALCSIVVHGIAAAPGMRWADPMGESQDRAP
jgi:NhaP-type Na+/H+ or K+/H+ antiporter